MPKIMIGGKVVKLPYPKKGKAKGAGKSYSGKRGMKKVKGMVKRQGYK